MPTPKTSRTTPAIAILMLAVASRATAEPITAGTQWVFRGSVAQLRPDRTLEEPDKTFDLILLADPADQNPHRFYWRVDERGNGAWPWAERFGLLTLDEHAQPIGHPGPSLLYDYGDAKAVVPLPPPIFIAGRQLAEDLAWEVEGLRYQVLAQQDVADRPAWPVQVHNNFGLVRTVWVDAQGLIVQLEERVFMNQGTEYRLLWRLAGSDTIAGEDLAGAVAAFEAMTDLRARLNRPARTQSDAWTADEREVLVRHLPDAQSVAADGPLAQLVRAAARDLELQESRADAVGKLATRFTGSRAPAFSAGSGRDKLSDADLKGHVTLLHFWDYRDEPLEEPYGQVGYLEFLYGRRKPEGLRIYGIAVDGRLNDQSSRGAAVAGVRKLKSFMNLSYPILLDGGELLKQFGDPRPIGGRLPLFVLVGPDGRIAHYHVGYYEVDKQQGLKQLDTLVGELIKKKS